jgi:hypothetical protein
MSRSCGRAGTSFQAPAPTHVAVAGSSVSPADQAMSMMTAFFTAQAKASAPAPTPALSAMLPPPSVPAPRLINFPLPPLPPPAEELQRFLEDFRQAKGINITSCRPIFEQSALTQDVIPYLTIARITELVGLLEGHAVKLQMFGKQWVASLEEQHLAHGFD